MFKVASIKKFFRETFAFGGSPKDNTVSALYHSRAASPSSSNQPRLAVAKLTITDMSSVSAYEAVLSASGGPIPIPSSFEEDICVIQMTEPKGTVEILIAPQALSLDGYSVTVNSIKQMCNAAGYEAHRSYASREVISKLYHQPPRPSLSAGVMSSNTASAPIDKEPTKPPLARPKYKKAAKQLLSRAATEQAQQLRVIADHQSAIVQYLVDGNLVTKHRWEPHVASGMLHATMMEINAESADHFNPSMPFELDGESVIKDQQYDLSASYSPSDEHGFELTITISQREAYTDIPRVEDIGFAAEQTAVLEKMLAEPNSIIYVSSAGGNNAASKLYSIANLFCKSFPDECKAVAIERSSSPYRTDFEQLSYSQDHAEGSRCQHSVIDQAVESGARVIIVDQIRSNDAMNSIINAVSRGVLCIVGHHANSSLNALMSLSASDRVYAKSLKLGMVSGVIHIASAPQLCSLCSISGEEKMLAGEISHQLEDLAIKYKSWFTQKTRLRFPEGCPECSNGVTDLIHEAEIVHIGQDLYPHLASGDAEAVYDAASKHELLSVGEKFADHVANGDCCPLDTYRVVGPANAYQRPTRVSPERQAPVIETTGLADTEVPGKGSNIVTLKLNTPLIKT